MDYSKTYHSIIIGEKNTWDDWHLIPSSRPVVNPPSVATKYVDAPGRNGGFDLTTILTGRPTYGNRTGSWEFIVVNDYWSDWTVAYSTIMNYVHGKEFKITLEDDPNYYYKGRVTVNNWKSDKTNSIITFDYHLDPFKYDSLMSSEEWEWDPFNFATDAIRSYNNLVVDGSRVVTVIGYSEPVCPIISSTNSMTMTYNGDDYSVEPGENYFPEVLVYDGENQFTFTGTGTITIEFRGGWL